MLGLGAPGGALGGALGAPLGGGLGAPLGGGALGLGGPLGGAGGPLEVNVTLGYGTPPTIVLRLVSKSDPLFCALSICDLNLEPSLYRMIEP